MNIRFLDQLDHVAEAIEVHCERRMALFLFSFSILYLLGTCLLASQKLMWHDELFTFYISSLPSVSDMWSVLMTGGEQIPPFFHIITRMSLSLFGLNELAIRLPEVVGFWLMSLCLFWFVSKRSSALYGFAAMLFPLVTEAYFYAYDARPYGIVLGFAGLSLICWQSAVERKYRKLSLVGLAVSVAAALSSHYYAVLLLVPLAVGEAARSISLRRLDLPIWVALGSAMTPLLLFLPLIERAKTYSNTFWAPPLWRTAVDFYYTLLAPALLPLVAMLVLSAVYSTTRPSRPSSHNQNSRSTPPFHEIAAALGFIVLPIVAFVLAKVVTGALTGRYALPSVIGFSILFAFAAYRMLDGRAIMGVSLAVSIFCGFMMLEVRSFRSLAETSLNQAKTFEFLRSDTESQLPIVVSDLVAFMSLAHYAPQDIASRLVYLADPQASFRHFGHSSVERNILDLKPWFGLKVEEYAPYIASQERFLVYGGVHIGNWLLFELTRANMRIELRGRDGNKLLFLVSPKG